MVAITPLMVAYIAALYCLGKGNQGRIADALALNWLVNQAIVMANNGYPDLPLFIAVDFMTGFWLASWEGGKVARRAATMFVFMIALNAAAYVNGSPVPAWHHTALFALAWIQLGVVGAMDDGIRKALDIAVRGFRHPISSTIYFIWGKK